MATPQLGHHHQATTFPQAAEYEKYRQWILGFIQREYNVDCSEVHLALASNFGLGGGGLYMKSTEGVGNLTMAASKTGKTKEELKGKYCVVDADGLWSMKKTSSGLAGLFGMNSVMPPVNPIALLLVLASRAPMSLNSRPLLPQCRTALWLAGA